MSKRSKRVSCGAILYTIIKNEVYIILGYECENWYPFKGRPSFYETYEEAAIREIKEETCNAVEIKSIDLECHYSTKNKKYKIGFVEVSPTAIIKFYKNRKKMMNELKDDKDKYSNPFLEKEKLGLFNIKNINKFYFPYVTHFPIQYFYDNIYKKNKIKSKYLRDLETSKNFKIVQKCQFNNIKQYICKVTSKNYVKKKYYYKTKYYYGRYYYDRYFVYRCSI